MKKLTHRLFGGHLRLGGPGPGPPGPLDKMALVFLVLALFIMPRPKAGALGDDAVWRRLSVWRLSGCLSRTWGLSRLSREQRPRKIGTEACPRHVTRTPLSGSKGQGHHSPGRFTVAATREAGAAVTVGTYWA